MEFKVKVSRNKLVALVFVLSVLTSLFFGIQIGAQSGFPSTTITSGPYAGAPTYTVYPNGTHYFAKNAYGAVSWSSTNATVTGNNALSYASAQNGTVVFTGVFYVDTPFSIKSDTYVDARNAVFIPLTNCSIFVNYNSPYGAGAYGTVNNAVYAGLGGDHNIVLDGANIEGKGDLWWNGSYAMGVDFAYGQDFTVKNCNINNTRRYGISFVGVLGGEIVDNKVSWTWDDDNIQAVYGCQRINILRNQCNGTLGDSVGASNIEADSAGEYLTIADNFCWNARKSGIALHNTHSVTDYIRSVTISRNTISTTGNSGIVVQGLLNGYFPDNIDISGNNINNTSTIVTTAPGLLIERVNNSKVQINFVNSTNAGPAIVITYGSGNLVTGNMASFGAKGIQMQNTENNTVSNNDFYSNSLRGIDLEGGCNNNSFTGNRIMRKHTGASIFIYNSTSAANNFNTFQNNYIQDGSTALDLRAGNLGNTFKNNIGLVTEKSFSGANTTATTAVINHGLANTATFVWVSFSTSAITGYTWSSSATQVTITPTGTLPASWTCYVKAEYAP